MDKIIEVKNISFSYKNEDETGINQIEVLKNVSLDIYKGEFIAVLGHNGCGKSTLAKHFNSVLLPDSGEVFVNGINTKDENKLFDIRQSVGMVFQNPDNQIVATIVEEDVAFALENLGVEPAEIRRRVDDALKTVNMFDYKDHAPHRLSGGQKQRVAIAGVIAMRPQCIVLDEPTAMLDPKGRSEVLKTIKYLNKNFNITIILITHYMEEAAQADRVVVMEKGQIILNDAPEKVFSQVDKLKSIGLDVPQVTELCYGLNQLGYNISTEIIVITSYSIHYTKLYEYMMIYPLL